MFVDERATNRSRNGLKTKLHPKSLRKTNENIQATTTETETAATAREQVENEDRKIPQRSSGCLWSTRGRRDIRRSRRLRFVITYTHTRAYTNTHTHTHLLRQLICMRMRVCGWERNREQRRWMKAECQNSCSLSVTRSLTGCCSPQDI